jgi:hypothetical protein
MTARKVNTAVRPPATLLQILGDPSKRQKISAVAKSAGKPVEGEKFLEREGIAKRRSAEFEVIALALSGEGSYSTIRNSRIVAG